MVFDDLKATIISLKDKDEYNKVMLVLYHYTKNKIRLPRYCDEYGFPYLRIDECFNMYCGSKEVNFRLNITKNNHKEVTPDQIFEM